MERKFNYVYITTNVLSGKQYVGSHGTDDIDDNYLGSGRYFLRALRKEGKQNFKREVLEECENIIEARKLEGFYIEKYNTLIPNGYNLSPKGGIGFKGANHSEHTKQKQREWQKGKTYEELYGPEKATQMKEKQRQKKLGTTTKRKGKGHKQELIEKYGEIEGLKHYDSFVLKQQTSHEGKIQSKETIDKRIKRLGDPWNKGKTYTTKPWSNENKLKLKKPKNTKQKEMLKNPMLIAEIIKMNNSGAGINSIVKQTGINYYLIKKIIS